MAKRAYKNDAIPATLAARQRLFEDFCRAQEKSPPQSQEAFCYERGFSRNALRTILTEAKKMRWKRPEPLPVPSRRPIANSASKKTPRCPKHHVAMIRESSKRRDSDYVCVRCRAESHLRNAELLETAENRDLDPPVCVDRGKGKPKVRLTGESRRTDSRRKLKSSGVNQEPLENEEFFDEDPLAIDSNLILPPRREPAPNQPKSDRGPKIIPTNFVADHFSDSGRAFGSPIDCSNLDFYRQIGQEACDWIDDLIDG